MKKDTLQTIYKVGLLLIILSFSAICCEVSAQYRPDALRSGPSAGSRSISDFERIDPYSGNLNFSLPLISVSGRGSAGISLALTIDQKWMRKEWSPGLNGATYPYLLPVPTDESTQDFTPADYEYNPIYVPNSAFAKSVFIPSECDNGSQGSSLTTITVTGSDGSHYDLADRASGGATKVVPCSGLGFNRGKVFDSIDGSRAVFIADSDVIDALEQNQVSISGKLITRDGTTLSFGSTDSVTDRNGNKTTVALQYTQSPPYANTGATLTDPNGRQTQIELKVNDIAPYNLCDRITYLGFGGATRYIRVSYKHLHDTIRPGLSLQTPRQLFPQWYGEQEWPYDAPGNQPDSTFDPLLPATVWLPNGQSYSIYYNSYAEVARVVLPTGGAVEYDWGFNSGTGTLDIFNPGNLRTDEPQRRLVERRVYSDGSTLDNKTTYSSLQSAGNHTGYVTESLYDQGGTHLVNRTVHYFYGIDSTSSESFTYHTIDPIGREPWRNGKEYQTDIFDSDGTTLLRRSTQTWTQTAPAWWADTATDAPLNNPVVSSRTTTLADTNQVSGQTFAYDSFGNPTDTYDYDYGSGAAGSFIRRTHTDYIATNPVNSADYTSDGIHITDLPSQTWISSDTNGNNKVSRTTYEYDNYVSDYNHASLTDRPNISGHDSNYGTSFAARGNLTKVTSFADAQNQTGAVSTNSQFDIAGNTVKTIDANGNATTIDFNDDFGVPDAEARTNTAPSQLNGQQAFAFPSSATNALGYRAYTQVDYYTGNLVDAEDINGNVNTNFYDDVLDRPTQSIFANNRSSFRKHTTIAYDDLSRKVTVTSDAKSYGDNLIKAESFYDEMGRTIETRSYETSSNYIASLTEYDSLGRAFRSSNPYRPYLSEAPQYTTTSFDALGRIVHVTTPDNAVLTHSYSGSTTTVTDQAGKKRSGTTDAIGRLLRVNEDPNGQNYETDYVYDVLARLRKTTQTEGQTTQNRFFMYNDLGRLVRAKQAEQSANSALNIADPVTGNAGWSVAYAFDNNGNITATTDALNRTVTGVYDNLNRLTSRTYSDGTPNVTFTFDDSNIANSKGHLTAVTSSVSSTYYTAFDELGRVKSSQQATNGQTYNFPDYSYDLSGALASQTYPSGRVVTNETDSIGRLSKVTSQLPNQVARTYLSDLTYTAFGAVQFAKLGNGRWESAVFDPQRLQIKQISLGGSAGDTSLSKIEYGYGTTSNNGALIQQKITVPGVANQIVQDYSYDSLNRLHSATETVNSQVSWKQTFDIDRFGNRRFDAGNTTTLGNCSQAVCNPNIDQGKNQLSASDGYSFDNDGNLTADPESQLFGYDGENRLKQVQNTTTQTTESYEYDGLGKRVRKLAGGQETVFLYDAFSKLVAEYSTEVSQNPKINYLTADSLGSPRVVTDAIGQVVSRHDYMPFGEEVAAGLGGRTTAQGYGENDSVRQQFTGYETDDESGLDYAQARYFSSKHGRFASVDPLSSSALKSDPQSLNRYSYVLNNPLNLTDPTGLCPPFDNRDEPCKRGDVYHIVDENGLPVTATYDGKAWTFSDQEVEKVESPDRQCGPCANEPIGGDAGTYGRILVGTGILLGGGAAVAGGGGEGAAAGGGSIIGGILGGTDGTKRGPTMPENGINGRDFEKDVLDALHVQKNTTGVVANGTSTVPDAITPNAVVEIKSNQRLSLSNQLRTQIEYARQTGKTFYLIVGPNTQRISGPLKQAVQAVGGKIVTYYKGDSGRVYFGDSMHRFGN